MPAYKASYSVGQAIVWPALSERDCVVVDFIDAHDAVAQLAPSSTDKHFVLPRLHAVVFSVLKDGSALAVYNGCLTAAQLNENPSLPILWLR